MLADPSSLLRWPRYVGAASAASDEQVKVAGADFCGRGNDRHTRLTDPSRRALIQSRWVLWSAPGVRAAWGSTTGPRRTGTNAAAERGKELFSKIKGVRDES